MLSGIGGALGVVVGYWSKKLLPFGQNAEMDWRVMAFVAGVSVLTGVVFGLIPAAAGDASRSGRRDEREQPERDRIANAAEQGPARDAGGRFAGAADRRRACSSARSRICDRWMSASIPSNILMFRVNPQLNRYEPERVAQLYRQLQTSLEALPGVRSVGLSRTALLSRQREHHGHVHPGRRHGPAKSTSCRCRPGSSRRWRSRSCSDATSTSTTWRIPPPRRWSTRRRRASTSRTRVRSAAASASRSKKAARPRSSA